MRKPRVLLLRPPAPRQPAGVGGVVLANIPVIDVEPVPGADEKVLEAVKECSVLVFTSPRTVGMFSPTVLEALRRLQAVAGLRIAAVGPKTRDVVVEAGLRVDLVPREYRGRRLAEEIAEKLKPRCVVLARSEKGVPDLPQTLSGLGITVVDIPVYRVVVLDDMARAAASIADSFDYVVFTSPSIAEAFTRHYENPATPGFKPVAIGPTTAAKLRELGYPEPLQPAKYTVDATIEAVLEDWKAREG